MAETLKDFLVGVKFNVDTAGAGKANQAVSELDSIIKDLGEVLIQAASAFQSLIGQMQGGTGAVNGAAESMRKGTESAGKMEQALRKANSEGRLSSLQQGKRNVNSLEQSMKKASGTLKKFAKMAVGYLVGSNVVNAFKSVMEFNEGLAKSAKELGKTIEQTRAYNLALQVMGKTAKEIEADASLKSTFNDLQKIGESLALPQAAAGLNNIGAIKNSLLELKMVGSYALQWIYYKAQEVAAGPLAETRKTLGDLRNWFSGNIKNIAQGIGQAFSWVVQIINSVVKAIKNIIQWVDKLPASIKIAGAAAIAVIVAVKSKIGLVTMIISAILLLIDDFVTYMEGGESLFGDFWGKCIEWAEKVKPVVQEVIEKISGFLSSVAEGTVKVVEWLDEMGLIEPLIAGIVAAFAAFEAIKIGKSIGNLITSFGGLNLKMVAIVAVIGLVVAALVWLIQNWDKVKEVAIQCWDAIKEWCVSAWEKVEEVWGNIVAWFSDIWNNLKSAAEPVWNDIKGFAASAWEGIKETWNAVTGWFSDLFGKIPGFASKAWSKIKSAFSSAGSWFTNNVVNPIKNAFNGISEWFSDTFGKAWNAVTETFGKVGEWAGEAWNAISDGISKAAGWVADKASAAGAWITQAGVDVGDFFKNGWNAIFGGSEPEPLTVEVDTEPVESAQTEVEAFRAAIESLAENNKLQEWYTEQFSAITQIVQEASAAVEAAMQAIKDVLSAVPENAITGAFNRIRASIQRSMSASASAVSRQVAAIKAALTSIPTSINVTVGTTFVQRYKTAVEALGGSADGQATPDYALGSTVNNIKNSSSSNTVSAPATFNVYGSDAKAAATQAAKINTDLTLRNVKAVLI